MYEYDSYRLEISLLARSLTAKVRHILLKIPFVNGRKRKRPLGVKSRREMPAFKHARHSNPVYVSEGSYFPKFYTLVNIVS